MTGFPGWTGRVKIRSNESKARADRKRKGIVNVPVRSRRYPKNIGNRKAPMLAIKFISPMVVPAT